MNSFGMSEQELAQLLGVFHRHLGRFAFKLWIFGSRATGSHQKYSDVDLLIECQQPNSNLLFKIIEELEESSFPYKIDLVELRKLAPEYAPSIHNVKKLLLDNSP